MNRKNSKLNKILRDHELWLESGREKGVRANLSDANLTGADLQGADLRGAKLSRAYLTGANLTGTNLWYAKLTGADLRGADLRGADLSYADFVSAQFEHEIMSADTLFECTMSWSQSCWVTCHRDFNTIEFV